MENLKTAYTDIRNVQHRVVHQVVSTADQSSRERLLAELIAALTQSKRDPSA